MGNVMNEGIYDYVLKNFGQQEAREYLIANSVRQPDYNNGYQVGYGVTSSSVGKSEINVLAKCRRCHDKSYLYLDPEHLLRKIKRSNPKLFEQVAKEDAK